MPDVFTKEKRSEVMAKIRSRGNRATELCLASLMRHEKIVGWRRHPDLFGRPDFAFAKQKVAVFVDGCFWHHCPKCFNQPKNNAEFWNKKIEANRRRDRIVNCYLRRKGWSVLRIWEHTLERKPELALKRLRLMLHT